MFSNLNFLTPRALESVKYSLNHNISALMRKFRCSTLVVEGGFCIQHIRIPLKIDKLYMDLLQIVSSTHTTEKILQPEMFKNQYDPKTEFKGGKNSKFLQI